jgi:hypothetical protein
LPGPEKELSRYHIAQFVLTFYASNNHPSDIKGGPMKRDTAYWGNLAPGAFWVCVVFIALILGMDSSNPSGATKPLIVILSIGCAVSLAVWGWCAFRVFEEKRKTWLSQR